VIRDSKTSVASILTLTANAADRNMGEAVLSSAFTFSATSRVTYPIRPTASLSMAFSVVATSKRFRDSPVPLSTAFTFGLVYWLATDNLWLCFFISTAVTGAQISSQVIKRQLIELILPQFQNIDNNINSLYEKVDLLESEVDELKDKVNELETKIDDLIIKRNKQKGKKYLSRWFLLFIYSGQLGNNASISLQALSLGASDYLTKPTTKFGEYVVSFYRQK
jgi:CheY-like chemotaxis protein